MDTSQQTGRDPDALDSALATLQRQRWLVAQNGKPETDEIRIARFQQQIAAQHLANCVVRMHKALAAIETIATQAGGERTAIANDLGRIRDTAYAALSSNDALLDRAVCHHVWQSIHCRLCGQVCRHQFHSEDGVNYCTHCGVAKCATEQRAEGEQ